jgi:hypothetical protein
MDVDVKLRYFGMKLGNGKILDPTYYKMPRSKFVWLWRTFVSENRDKRATPTIREEN